MPTPQSKKKQSKKNIKPGDLIKYRDMRPGDEIPTWIDNMDSLEFGVIGLVLRIQPNPYQNGSDYYVEFLDSNGDFILAELIDVEKLCDGGS